LGMHEKGRMVRQRLYKYYKFYERWLNDMRILNKVIVAGLLALYMASSAMAAITVKSVLPELAKYGMVRPTWKPGEVTVGDTSTSVRLYHDYNGNVVATTVVFNGTDMPNTYRVLALCYLIIQINMGKNHVLDSRNVDNFLHKMRYLDRTITHNLKLNKETRFAYDDLDVLGYKDEKNHLILVGFKPSR
jgi:hypothetical protein